MIKAVIFDFFGVIALTTRQIVAEKYDLNEQQRRDLTDLNKAFDNGFINDDQFLHTFAEIVGIPYDSFVHEFYESDERFRVYDEMLNYVRELRKTLKVGLLSNVSRDAYRAFVDSISGEFDSVIKSYEVQLAKPDVAIFELMARKLEVDVSECVMIDDGEVNCQGARAAGMEAILHVSLNNTKSELSDILNLSVYG